MPVRCAADVTVRSYVFQNPMKRSARTRLANTSHREHPRYSADVQELLSEFANYYSAGSAESAMITACGLLRQQAGEITPPIGLHRILRICMARKREAPIDSAGRLEMDGGRFVIVVRAGSSWRRQRFTVAHEIGHILLLRAFRRSPAQLARLREPETWAVIEDLCDLAAAELLVPRDDFAEQIETTPFSGDGLQKLYDRYLTNYAPLFLRFVDLFPGSTLSVWRRFARRPGESSELRVYRSYRNGAGPWFPPGMTTTHLAPDIVSAAFTGKTVVTDRMLIDGGRKTGVSQAIATRLPHTRSIRQQSLPQFGGRRVPDEPTREPQTVLLIRGRKGSNPGVPAIAKLEEAFWSQLTAFSV